MALKIKELMTPSPQTINAEQNIKFAQNKMRELNVRHLPVLDAGRLVGILSERDIQFIESFDKLNPEEIKVDEAFTNEPYTVESNMSVSEVCADMVEKKIGSAMITEGGKLVGIFTWIDALSHLAKSS